MKRKVKKNRENLKTRDEKLWAIVGDILGTIRDESGGIAIKT
jgi:hypothetical protein